MNTKPGIFLKLILVILFVSSGTYLYWLLYRKPLFGIDDANIFFIYMRNFAEGYGFVYNPGGEKVEGFTSLLWTLTGSIFFLFSDRPEIFLLLLNILLVSITLWQVIILVDKVFEENRLLSPFACFLLGAVVVLPGYFDWTVISLMESGLWSCILISIVITLCRFELPGENHKQNNFLLSVLLILLVMCRPESYLWGAAFIAIRYFQLRRLRKQDVTILPVRNILIPLSAFIIAASAITVWRLTYFGFPFPNTYYAKVSSDHVANFIEGARYDYNFFGNNFFLLVVFIVSIIYVINSFRKSAGNKLEYCVRIILAAIIVALAVPLYTGGDHFGQVRFMQPVVPLFYLLFFIIMMEYVRLYTIKIRMYFAVMVSLVLVLFSPANNIIDYALGRGGIDIEFVVANDGREVGNEMSDFFSGVKPLPAVGLMMAGARAYAYSGPSIDLWGLNNVSIAHASKVKTGVKNHAAFDKKIFYEISPDIFIPMGFVNDTSQRIVNEKKPDSNGKWYRAVYKGIFDEDEFRKKYSLVFISKKNHINYLFTYANNNFLSRLDTSSYSFRVVHY